LRIESLCPFPFLEIVNELKKYKNAQVTWAQEEPSNAGVWLYARPRLENICKLLKRPVDIGYAGRPIMAATAVGYSSSHNE
jgi:2-oxoglutarate dehydrogenase E1 component